eukprot:381402-Alexandrium_andersonii.AAC.1
MRWCPSDVAPTEVVDGWRRDAGAQQESLRHARRLRHGREIGAWGPPADLSRARAPQAPMGGCPT